MLMIGARFSSMTMVNFPEPSALTVDFDSFLKQPVVDRPSRAVPMAAEAVNLFMRWRWGWKQGGIGWEKGRSRRTGRQELSRIGPHDSHDLTNPPGKKQARWLSAPASLENFSPESGLLRPILNPRHLTKIQGI
jgi:hypothetical protein